jgi:hypothetical protein
LAVGRDAVRRAVQHQGSRRLPAALREAVPTPGSADDARAAARLDLEVVGFDVRDPGEVTALPRDPKNAWTIRLMPPACTIILAARYHSPPSSSLTPHASQDPLAWSR